MPDLKFTKSTDQEHVVKLDSYLIHAAWRNPFAIMGQSAALEVGTAFVGQGAQIKITCKSEKGKKVGKVDGQITSNKYVGEMEIPHGLDLDDRIYFEVDLPKNGISGESNMIEVIGPVQATNMKWSDKEARRGDILTLSADIQGVRTGTEVALVIYEYDQDGAHDRITEIPAFVKSKKIEAKWEYEYHEDTDEIATQEEAQRYGSGYNPPEYFFTIKLADVEIGKKQESGLLRFKDWILIELKDKDGNTIPNRRYTIAFADGTNASGTLDNSGCARHDGIPPGPYTVQFAKTDSNAEAESDDNPQSDNKPTSDDKPLWYGQLTWSPAQPVSKLNESAIAPGSGIYAFTSNAGELSSNNALYIGRSQPSLRGRIGEYRRRFSTFPGGKSSGQAGMEQLAQYYAEHPDQLYVRWTGVYEATDIEGSLIFLFGPRFNNKDEHRHGRADDELIPEDMLYTWP